MMKAMLTAKDITGLDRDAIAFVVEYMKDYNPRLAAERAGLLSDEGNKLLAKPCVLQAIAQFSERRLKSSDIDAEWVMMELVDNHILARQTGKLTASNTALGTIAKLATVDAFAADKVMTVTDQAVLERLNRARKRAAGTSDTPDSNPEAAETEDDETPDSHDTPNNNNPEPSFM